MASSATRAELILAVEQLTEQVRLLGNIIDDLTTELQWHNRNPTTEHPPPFVLTSMPADPTARDWRVNAASADPVSEAPASTAASRRATLFE
jgi:hypothetical protein